MQKSFNKKVINIPYQPNSNLGGENASKTGHLEVIKNPFVQDLIREFNKNIAPSVSFTVPWQKISSSGKKLKYIFAVDGSYQTIASHTDPPRLVTFVKTALLSLDYHKLSKIDKEYPHPLALKEILQESAVYHSTIFPLKNTSIPGLSIYHCIRKIVYESMKNDHLQGEPLKTLKWLAYRKWNNTTQGLDKFNCPHCRKEEATLPFDVETGICPNCKGSLYITDWLGLHIDMQDNFGIAPEQVASQYMLIHELILLFTGIRYYWENNDFEVLNNSLFIKDGPLFFRAQFTKLVGPIRDFMEFAKNLNVNIHLIGQEKTGVFTDHLEIIGKNAPEFSYFIPDQNYIHNNILQRPPGNVAYGYQHSVGSRIFVKLNTRELISITVPTGKFKENPVLNDFIGLDDIFATIPELVSRRYQNALYPIELANGIASLSTYPSAEILRLFLEKS
jgi:hypothetical protein